MGGRSPEAKAPVRECGGKYQVSWVRHELHNHGREDDYEQEEGVLLTNSLVDFKEEGAWKTYTFAFSKREYSAAATQLKNGIAGIVILPTYSSGVTLAEGNKYKCYIDDIEIL